MEMIRHPAVAGMFYPDNGAELRRTVDAMIARQRSDHPPPKAMILPHAGYIYSGSVAATGYALLAPVRATIRRVVLLGPAHRVALAGIAVPTSTAFETPLGLVPVDSVGVETALTLPQCRQLDAAHKLEHSLEVHLPFLQICLDDFTMVPLVVGDADAERVGEVIEALWGGEETLIVISSDLSHFLDYRAAQVIDDATTHAIEALAPERISHEGACGRNPVNGMLLAARNHGLRVTTLDLRNSGDTAGGMERVVGYGAYAFH